MENQKLPPRTIAYIQLHIAVVLFGFTAILGDLISLQAAPLVWWRVVITCVSMVFLVRLPSLVREVGWSQIGKFMGIGILTGLHWIAFYGSIKYANASVALVCLAMCSLFTALVEPILTGSKFRRLDVLIGIVIVPAMVLIVSELQVEFYQGVYLGLLSAFLAAVFSTLNKKYIHTTSPLRIVFLELTSAMLFISLILVLFYDLPVDITPRGNDMLYLIVLAVLCTTLAQYLNMASLKHISAFNSVLVINLEPVYGIVLAAVILHEYAELTTTFYIGAALIISTVFIYPLLAKWRVFE